MASELYSNQNYSKGLDYYSGYIIEYDLSKANINALLSRGVINKNLYTKLYNADKQYREVYIGNMIKRDERVYKEIQTGIIDAKRQFVETNNIKDEEIFSIRNDAMYILSERPMEQQFGNYYFAKKNVYTFFFKFYSNKEWYYRFDRYSNKDIIDIKGINNDLLLRHQGFFLKLLADISYSIQMNSIEDTLEYINNFYEEYINRKLDIRYYREFNNISEYRVSFPKMNKSYTIPELSQTDLENIDINFNLRILRDLIKVVDQIYFNQRR